MKDINKLVSIFIPYYNDRAFLRASIESVLNQSYKMFELILLDHASTDDSAQIAQSYTDPRIKHISLSKNLGAGGGALLCEFLNVAKGDYVKLFCADDVMCPDCIATFVDYMEANPQVDVVFGNIEYVDVHLNSLKDNWFNNRRDFDVNDKSPELLHKFKTVNVLPYIGNFAKREAFDNVNINQTFIIMFDMSLWVEMLLNGRNFAFLDNIVAFYRIHANQIATVKKSQKISVCSLYESIAYFDIFYSYIKNIDMLKIICVESPFLDELEKDDLDLFEFVIAHYFLLNNHMGGKINAYLKLEKIFSNNKLKSKIERRFSYGVAEFRKDYLGVLPTSFKRRVYKKQPENLTISEIMFLFFRALWNLVSLRNVRKKRRYTV